MNKLLEFKLSIEEIYIIAICRKRIKNEVIAELEEFKQSLNSGEALYADMDMRDIIDGTIADVRKLTDEEMEEALSYPV